MSRLSLMADMLGDEEDDGVAILEADRMDLWNPKIEKVELRMPRGLQKFSDPAQARREKTRKKDRMPFTVKLDQGDAGDDNTKRFKFNQGSAEVGDGTERKKTACMTAWKGVKGSRYWDGIFGSIPLPNSRVVVLHFYHSALRLFTVHPGAEPGEAEPCTLPDILQARHLLLTTYSYSYSYSYSPVTRVQ